MPRRTAEARLTTFPWETRGGLQIPPAIKGVKGGGKSQLACYCVPDHNLKTLGFCATSNVLLKGYYVLFVAGFARNPVQ